MTADEAILSKNECTPGGILGRKLIHNINYLINLYLAQSENNYCDLILTFDFNGFEYDEMRDFLNLTS